MAITTTLAKLYRYFRGWHEEEYDDIHRVTDDIISDKNNIRASYPISSYGASKIQQQIGNITFFIFFLLFLWLFSCSPILRRTSFAISL